ncbi:MAG: phosphotyrosine protein phosphatase [Deltaproteobacteria bacterium]|nr:phosphotyrosine protein phosphatase [Deltaproteobacteria bacterium]
MREKKHFLFVCSRNRLRSPTAERLFSSYPDIEVASAGTAPDAEEPLSRDLLTWADLVFVMEKSQQRKLTRQFGSMLKNKRVICLDISDQYAYMDPALVRLLQRKVSPFLAKR